LSVLSVATIHLSEPYDPHQQTNQEYVIYVFFVMIGNETKKRVPIPTLLSKVIVPPSASTARFTIQVPNPVPEMVPMFLAR
jgi:hypothetical protein